MQYLEQVILVDVCSQAGQRLATGTSQANQKCVRSRLRQHSTYTRHMFDRKPTKLQFTILIRIAKI